MTSRVIVASARKYPYWLRPHFIIVRGGPATDQMRCSSEGRAELFRCWCRWRSTCRHGPRPLCPYAEGLSVDIAVLDRSKLSGMIEVRNSKNR